MLLFFLDILLDLFVERLGDLFRKHKCLGFISGDLLLYLERQGPEEGDPVRVWFALVFAHVQNILYLSTAG